MSNAVTIHQPPFISSRERSPCPYLHSADEAIINIVTEDLLPLALFAGPAPHVLVLAMPFLLIQYGSANGPDDDTEEEESDGKNGVIYRSLLSAPMATPPISVEDADSHHQGDGCDAEKSNLRPYLLLRGPRRQLAPVR